MPKLLEPPEENTPFFTQRTQLDGTDYLFTFKYNFRTEMWMLRIETLAQELIVNQAVVIGVNLLRNSNAAAKPPGELLAIPNDSTFDRPRLNDIGNRVDLYYLEAGV